MAASDVAASKERARTKKLGLLNSRATNPDTKKEKKKFKSIKEAELADRADRKARGLPPRW